MGYNKENKGARSYYPLFCTVQRLEQLGVEYSISVPFERFTTLNGLIEKRQLWWSLPGLRRQKPPVRQPLEATELD